MTRNVVCSFGSGYPRKESCIFLLLVFGVTSDTILASLWVSHRVSCTLTIHSLKTWSAARKKHSLTFWQRGSWESLKPKMASGGVCANWQFSALFYGMNLLDNFQSWFLQSTILFNASRRTVYLSCVYTQLLFSRGRLFILSKVNIHSLFFYYWNGRY